jgi:hypothetical protein
MHTEGRVGDAMKAVILLALGAAALGAALLPGQAAAAALVAGAHGGSLEPVGCSALEVTLKTSVNGWKGTYAGKTVTLTGKVKNLGTEPLEKVAVGFHLPAGGALCRTKATLYPNPRSQEVQVRTDAGANVYWEGGFTLGAGKWRKFELKAEVSAALAEAGGAMEVAAVGYLLDGHCTAVTEPETVRGWVVGSREREGRGAGGCLLWLVGWFGLGWLVDQPALRRKQASASAIKATARAINVLLAARLTHTAHTHKPHHATLHDYTPDRSRYARWGRARPCTTRPPPSALPTCRHRTRSGPWRWPRRTSGAARRGR